MEHGNLLAGPPPTYLPEDPAADELEYGVSPTDVAAAHPAAALGSVEIRPIMDPLPNP